MFLPPSLDASSSNTQAREVFLRMLARCPQMALFPRHPPDVGVLCRGDGEFERLAGLVGEH